MAEDVVDPRRGGEPSAIAWSRRFVLAAIVAITCTACWVGDQVPSLDRVGATRVHGEEVSILFAGCPGDGVDRVVLELTDDDFEETEQLLWEIEAVDDSAASARSFVVGDVPVGFREVTALDDPLQPGDHVHLAVTSRDVGTIPMSFVVDDVPQDEVLVRRTRYRALDDFGTQAAESCPGE
jgi:hypothetical protein